MSESPWMVQGPRPFRVAYQGIAGAFSEEAVHRFWHARAVAHPTSTFAAALDAVVSGDAECAVIPTWNSTIGPIASACAALLEHATSIVRVREVDLPVRHCLLARAGTTLDDVRYVGSHPAALAQCSRLFRGTRPLVACEAFDTAGAALELSRYAHAPDSDREPWYARLPVADAAPLAVIASARAGERYGLVVLQRDVQDDPTNLTRFTVVRAVAAVAAQDESPTSTIEIGSRNES